MKDQEVGVLLEAMRKFRIPEGVIITNEKDAVENYRGAVITYKPAWKFLLGI